MLNRKGLSVVVVLVILSILFCFETASADSEWEYELTSGGLCITGYKGSDEEVVIPSEIDGYAVTSIGKQAFINNQDISSITIPETVTSIGAEAFCGDVKLSQLSFNARNCVVPDIWIYDGAKGAGVFSGAGSASPNGLKVTFGSEVERVPDHLFDTASTEEYGQNGYPYAYVTEVEFSDSVTEIGTCAFKACKSLQSVTIGNGIRNIGSFAFYGCSRMNALVISDKVTEIGEYAFSGCEKLEDIEWGNGLGSIDKEAFSNCNSLKNVTLPLPLTSIGRRAFADCKVLETVLIPETVTSIKAEAFCGDIKLSQLSFNARNCVVPDIWIYDGAKGAGVFSGAGSASPNGLKVTFGSEVERVPDHLFDTASTEEYGQNGYPYAYVTEVYIPENVETIGDYAFSNCRSLISVEVLMKEGQIGKQVFSFCTRANFAIYGFANSAIESYAKENELNFKVKVLKETDATAAPDIGEVNDTKQTDEAIKTSELEDTCPVTKAEHKVQWLIIKNASCEEEGLINEVCSMCGKIISEEIIEPLGHDESGEMLTDIEATCTTDGHKSRRCLICNEVIMEEVIPAFGHDESAQFTVLKKSSCNEPGMIVKLCPVCGITLESMETEKLDHQFDQFIKISGVMNGICSICGVVVPVEE